MPQGPPPRHVVRFRNLGMALFDLYREMSDLDSPQYESMQKHMHAALIRPGCASMQVFLL